MSINDNILIAVIDSGVDLNNKLINSKNVKCIEIIEGNIKKTNHYEGSHGTIVCSYIFKEFREANILSIKILNKNNKGSIHDLIKAIEYCIKNNVDVINLSLGLYLDKEHLTKLEFVCNKAINNGIAIFAAHNNTESKISYPASFKNIFGVKYSKNDNKIIDIDKYNNISISRPLMNIDNNGNINIKKLSNSYLCANTTGIFCSFLRYFNLEMKDKLNTKKFLIFLIYLNNNYAKKIFNVFNKDKNSKLSYYPINNINTNIINNYIGLGEITFKFNELDKIDIIKIKNKTNIFIIGDLYPEYSPTNIYNIVEKLSSNKINTLMAYAYLNTFERYILSKKFNVNINSQNI